MRVRSNFLSKLILTAVIFAYTPLLFAGDDDGEAKFLNNIRQLTYDGVRSGEGYFSADGRALIFQSEREPGNPFFQIYILDLETGDSHRVSPGKGKTTCGFFRFGTQEVLFASSHLDSDAELKQKQEYEMRAAGKNRRYAWDYDQNMDIFTANHDGTHLKRLTATDGYDAEGSYSPDGSQIVFCSLRNAYNGSLSSEDEKRLEIDPAYFGEIYIMNADGSNQKRLTNWPGYDGGPFFTPDSERIVWRHFEENGAIADVYTMRLDGSDIQRVTDFKAMSWAPFFHPSGKYLIFASNKLGFSNFETYIVDALGDYEPVRVTFTDGFDGLPVFSPDGLRLAWTSKRNKGTGSQLFIADWNHEAAVAALAAAPLQQKTALSDTPSFSKTALDNGTNNDTGLSTKIVESDLRSEVSYLASDKLEGRMSGTDGTKAAANYIVSHFQTAGLKPIGDGGTFFQKFHFTSGIKLKDNFNRFEIKDEENQIKNFQIDTDFRPLSFSSDGEIEGEVVFAGYGLTVPGELGVGYDSYYGLDVKDKIVLVLRYVPEAVDMERRQQLNRYAGLRYKALSARERGAKALLVVTGPNSPNPGQLVPLSFDFSGASSGIMVASINEKIANILFADSGKNLKGVQSELDKENPHAEGGFFLPKVKVKLSVGLERVRKADHNVLAMLPASSDQNFDEYIVLGAHYDHIGYGEIGSLARKGEEGQIHNGADDNASGTSVILELAASLAEAQKKTPQDFKRHIIFALWSGEELGTIGSSHFVGQNTIGVKKIAAYLNFDMVGRLRENNLILQGLGSSSVWKKVIEKRNVAAGFNLTLQDDPYLPTDVTPFYLKKIPSMSFFTGSHEDYNRPTDDAETLNYQGLERIGKFGQGIVIDLVKSDERPDYLVVERSGGQGGDRETLRAYLGTIPDYVGESEGVKLSGVKAGGPADKAGLQGEDIIVKFAGQKITNIYDYTYALDAVKIGEPVEVEVLRNGKKVVLTVIPEARK